MKSAIAERPLSTMALVKASTLWIYWIVPLALFMGNSSICAFDRYEHYRLGDATAKKTVAIVNGESFSFAECTSIAGDYVATPKLFEQILSNNPSFLLYIKKCLLKNRESEPDCTGTMKEAVFKTYTELAKKNYAHFVKPSESEMPDSEYEIFGCGPGSIDCYEKYHNDALAEATKTMKAPKLQFSLDRTLLFEAFAAHFLADSYSAGHIRTRRYDVQKAGNKLLPMFMENFIMYSAEETKKGLVDGIIFSDPDHVLSEIEKALRTQLGSIEFGFGDFISRVLHDYDSRNGLKIGDLFLYGDEHLGSGATLPVILKQLQKSMFEISQAHEGKLRHSVLGMQVRKFLSQCTTACKTFRVPNTPQAITELSHELWSVGVAQTLQSISMELGEAIEAPDALGITAIQLLSQNNRNKLKNTWPMDVFRSRVLTSLTKASFLSSVINYTPSVSLRNDCPIPGYLDTLKQKSIALETIPWDARRRQLESLLGSGDSCSINQIEGRKVEYVQLRSRLYRALLELLVTMGTNRPSTNAVTIWPIGSSMKNGTIRKCEIHWEFETWKNSSAIVLFDKFPVLDDGWCQRFLPIFRTRSQNGVLIQMDCWENLKKLNSIYQENENSQNLAAEAKARY